MAKYQEQIPSSQLTTKYTRLERLCKWEHVKEVNDQLLSGVSPLKVAQWCRENDFFISNQKMYDYKDMLLQSIHDKVAVEKILGIPGRASIQLPIPISEDTLQDGAIKIKSELEVLDTIIQRGFESILANNNNVRLADAMRAIAMKNVITKGNHGGLTEYGLEQLKAIEEAKFKATIEVIKKYIPEERYDELEEAIAKAEHDFYEENAPEYLEEYDKASRDD